MDIRGGLVNIKNSLKIWPKFDKIDKIKLKIRVRIKVKNQNENKSRM